MFRVCVFVAFCSFWANVAPEFVPNCEQPFASYRHPEDCTRWIRCNWGMPWEMPSCQTGLRFSERAKVCVRPGSEWDDCNTTIIDVNECSANPCKNEASCANLVNSYSCTCQPGWTGTNCDQDIDDCIGVTCHNGGVCVDYVTYYECSCPTGFEGTLCETVGSWCPKDYSYDEGLKFCHKYYFDHKDYDASEAVCVGDGGHLALVKDNDMFQFILQLIIQKTGDTCVDLWIQGKKVGGSIVDVNGAPVPWLSWAPREPDTDECLKIEDWGDKCQKMAVMPCTNNEDSLCQISLP